MPLMKRSTAAVGFGLWMGAWLAGAAPVRAQEPAPERGETPAAAPAADARTMRPEAAYE
jgi:hypothetical protein